MQIKLHDHLRNQNVTIRSEHKTIKIFNCGPTVSDFIHIGHVRNALLPDVLLKALHVLGWEEVVSITNVTNISEKIYLRSKNEAKHSWDFIGNHFMKEWQEDLLSCNISLPNIIMPDTKHVSSIIEFIQQLLSIEAAYIKGQSVYFDRSWVKTVTAEHHYNQVAEQSDLLKLVLNNQDDFVLWESVPDGDEMVWESPWGIGRPGKHIPCSNVIHSHCSEDDLIIHCGGDDLLNHHSCEFAQNLAVSNNETVADVWLYNSLVHVQDQKMGKSLGNSVTVRELLSQYDANTLRWYLLSTPFNQVIHFSREDLDEAAQEWKRVNDIMADCHATRLHVSDEAFYNQLVGFLADDLRVHDVIGTIKRRLLDAPAAGEAASITAGCLLDQLGFTFPY